MDIKNDSYWANIERANEWGYAEMISKAGKPVDKDEWLMTPQTVNAYYNPTTNEICFSSYLGLHFDRITDDAMNYGAIGVVIGHEMTHGFDDQGRQYDKDRNLKDWWTEEDAKKFEERAQVMVNFFDSIEVAPGVCKRCLIGRKHSRPWWTASFLSCFQRKQWKPHRWKLLTDLHRNNAFSFAINVWAEIFIRKKFSFDETRSSLIRKMARGRCIRFDDLRFTIEVTS